MEWSDFLDWRMGIVAALFLLLVAIVTALLLLLVAKIVVLILHFRLRMRIWKESSLTR